ncbi:MAG: hypothetical protein ABI435_03750 [Pseudolysinimonas sp.]
MIRVRAVPPFVVLAVLLAGCTSPPPAVEPTVDGPVARVPVEIPDGVVATGDILLADGSVFGTATLSWEAGALKTSIPDLTSLLGDEQSIVAFADSDVSFAMCGTDNLWQIGLGDPAAMDSAPMPESAGDPSYLRYLLVMPYWRDGGSCPEPIVGLARLDWTIPDTRPWLDPIDSGRTGGAQGGVLAGDDRPIAYRTASGDVWAEIAARFGITSDDLTFLNPQRPGGSVPETAYADQILNLDPTNRGDSETRRPGSPLTQSDEFH